MKNRLSSIVLVCLLVTVGFLGFITFESNIVSASNTWYVGSGTGNDTTSIQDAIDNYANPGDTVFVYSGIYTENVDVYKTINLIGEDRDTTIIDGGGGFSDVVDVGANWVNITSFAITNGSYGIHISYSNNISIIDNIFSDTRYGINLEYSPNNILIDNTLLEVGISIQGDGPNVWNTHSIDTSNTVNGKPVFYWKNQNGGTIPPGAGQVILANCTNVKIENQNISNGAVGIQLGFSNNNYIAKNIASLNNRYGIHLYFSENNTLTNNTACLNDATGILLYNSRNNTVIHNNVSNNNINPFMSNGIMLEFSDYNTIAYNDVSSNGLEGIGLGSSSIGNTINNNNVSNTERGINLHSQCSNNRIINNNVTGNRYGIRIYASSHNNDIINNDVSNNIYGIYFAGSYNNNIYHNNLINNTNQGYDDTNNGNQWDNGYPSGGNYWSDFDDPGDGAYDDYQGIDQNVLGSDGKVDNGTIGGGGKNPYVIDSDSQDNYPLINFRDTLPPIITNLQPPDSSTTNDNTPTVCANYSDPSGINVSSVVLKVDGIDVTFSATVTPGGVIYIPLMALSDGVHTVYLEVQDNFDNLALEIWTFIVDTALTLITNLTTKVVNNGNNVELEWEPPISPILDHYLIYRADSATEFDFTAPYNSSTTWPNPKNTTWIDPDPSVTQVDDDFYYIIRATNFNESDVSATSNTAGVWTRTFQPGVSTFSLPLEPFAKKDTEFYCQDMNASYIKWMNLTTHTWMRHDKGSSENNTLVVVGESYEIGFLGKSTQTKYTFTGMPGAMILYDNVPFGFDVTPSTGNANSLTATVDSGGNVTLNWTQPANMGSGDRYYVLRSTSRDGFWGTAGVNYTQLAVLPFDALSYQDIGNATAGTEYYYMIVPVNLSTAERGVSSYSIGVWTAGYLAQYDTIGIPLKLSNYQTADWYCDNIPDTVGINYYIHSEQRWGWHSTRMPAGAYDPILEMTEGYQISTSGATKYTFIGH